MVHCSPGVGCCVKTATCLIDEARGYGTRCLYRAQIHSLIDFCKAPAEIPPCFDMLCSATGETKAICGEQFYPNCGIVGRNVCCGVDTGNTACEECVELDPKVLFRAGFNDSIDSGCVESEAYSKEGIGSALVADRISFEEGRIGQGVRIDFNDKLTYYAIDPSGKKNINLNQGMIDFFFKPLFDASSQLDRVYFHLYKSGYPDQTFMIYYRASDHKMCVQQRETDPIIACAPINIDQNEWYHFAYIWTQNTAGAFYINGEHVETTARLSDPGLPGYTGVIMYIGSKADRTKQVKSVIDGFRISDFDYRYDPAWYPYEEEHLKDYIRKSKCICCENPGAYRYHYSLQTTGELGCGYT